MVEVLRATNKKPDYCLVIDSSSADNKAALAREHGFNIHVIPRAEFNHGATRQLGVGMLTAAEIIVFLTHDALLTGSDAIEKLFTAFDDERVGAAHGRQLPHEHAGPIGARARIFNYPAHSEVRGVDDRKRFGIKTAFISNSFAAYRRSGLSDVGGFPTDTIMNEDTYVAGKMPLSDWKIAYRADAQVYHSHDYRFLDEFKRYFDIGVFYARTRWLQERFGNVSGEGRRYVISELRYLRSSVPSSIPFALLRSILKWLGFELGISLHQALPFFFKIHFSLHHAYWSRTQPEP